MDKFIERYNKLNPEQREAVDHIEGPLLVVAGPGTGKTEILSLRVANIIRKTEISPKNILCLTFTVSASQNMRKRLSELIGRDAYKVPIHTFHSFGVHIIESYPEYYYHGTAYSAADDITQIEILEDILSDLPHDNELGNMHPEGGFAYLGSIKSAVSELKKAGLSPEDFKAIVEFNKNSLEQLNPGLRGALSSRVSKKSADAIRRFIDDLGNIETKEFPFPSFGTIVNTLMTSLTNVLSDVEKSAKTTPITVWKNGMTSKDKNGALILRDTLYIDKLLTLAEVYSAYQRCMHAQKYYDYDDMILDAIKGIESTKELRHNLKNLYQYILVDEFQDTNDAQMKLLSLISDSGDSPNVMAVGDDDQAIYKFQGAQIKNIQDFHKSYPNCKVVTITSNYRSKQKILDLASYVINQSEERLSAKLPFVEKNISSKIKTDRKSFISLDSFQTGLHEYYWIANKIKELIVSGVEPSDIAVIARYHQQLEQLSLLLNKLGVPLTYERERNVLEDRHVKELITICSFISTLGRKKSFEADELLPEILSYPLWGLDRKKVWEISRRAHKERHERKTWLEIMLEHEDLYIQQIARFLLELGALSQSESLEKVLDEVMGSEQELAPQNEHEDLLEDVAAVENKRKERFVSPFKEYYFGEEKRKENPLLYFSFLSSLKAFIRALSDHKKDSFLKVDDMIRFVEIHKRNDLPIIDNSKYISARSAVNLLTAHKAKGLEFDTVFIISCQEEVWSGGRRGSMLPMPLNLPISPGADTHDDQLRLFYVALTRAKYDLYLSSYQFKENSRESSLLPFITLPQVEESKQVLDEVLLLNEHKFDIEDLGETQDMLSLSWEAIHSPPLFRSENEVLDSLVEDYRLSVTHLNNFLNVERGGPHSFFLQNLLRFPQSQNYNNSYGLSVHSAIEFIYKELKKTGSLPELPDVLGRYDEELLQQRLNPREFKKYSQKGRDALSVYYKQKVETFDKSHFSEFNFYDQGVMTGDAHLSGKIDKMVPVSGSVIEVHDFKTGKAKTDWKGKSTYEKTLLYNYRRQLVFYKILVENSKDFGGKFNVHRGVLEFVEPKDGELIDLEWEIGKDELARTQELIKIVYGKVCALDFPDTSGYKNDLSGITAFEDDLLDGKI